MRYLNLQVHIDKIIITDNFTSDKVGLKELGYQKNKSLEIN